MLLRACLESLYRVCGALAGLFLLLIAVFVLIQIVGRLIGVLVAGTDDLAGFALVATSFFALAYTFRSGGHIRVTLLVQQFTGKKRQAIEVWCLGCAVLGIGYFGYHAAEMAWESWVFGDMSFGVVSIPLWIPQTTMALGTLTLGIALVDSLVAVLRGQRPEYLAADDGAAAQANSRAAGETLPDRSL